MRMSNRRRRRPLTWWQIALMSTGITMIFAAWQGLRSEVDSHPRGEALLDVLDRADVLPTPTRDVHAPLREIVFPAAALASPIISAIRTADSWETRYLGDSVGHLEGTAWLDDPNGNIVLAGHVETETGNPGPFADLFRVKPDDLIILRDGDRAVHYRVMSILRAASDDIKLVQQDGRARLTLITCTDWDYRAREYRSRLVVIAEPIATLARATRLP